MRTPLRITLPVAVLLGILAGLSACKKSEPASHGSEPAGAQTPEDAGTSHVEDGNTAVHEAETPVATPALHDANGVELVTFEPELLLSDAYTMGYMVLLPPEDEKPLLINLKRSGRREDRLRVRVAVECASEVAFEELKGRAKYVGRAVEVVLENRTADACRSLEDKMQIKEDIIQELRDRMKRSKAIKQVYFLEFRFI